VLRDLGWSVSANTTAIKADTPFQVDITALRSGAPFTAKLENGSGEVITTRQQTLDSGGSTLTFDPQNIDGLNADDGPYTVTATDGPTTNADRTAEVTVQQTATPALSNLQIAAQGTAATITEGENESVSVTVENVGDRSGSFTVGLDIDGTATDSVTTAELAAGETATVTFDGVTGTLAAGEYSISVSTAEDERTGTLTVSEQSDPPEPDPAEFETSITDVNDAVVAGDTVTVSYTVENVGDESGTQDIDFTVNGTVETTLADVSLEGGASTAGTVTYETNVEDVPGISVAVESTDDTATETVAVRAIPTLTIGEFSDEFPNATAGTDYGTVAIPIEETAGVESTNLSVRLVVAGDDGSEPVTETITGREVANESVTVEFAVGTIDDPDEYTATVSVDAATAEPVTASHAFEVTAAGGGDDSESSDGDESSGSEGRSDDESKLEIDYRENGTMEIVSVTVQNPEEGEQFAGNLAAVNSTLATDAATIDELAFTAPTGRDLSLRLTATPTPTETTPNRTMPSQSDVALGYLSVENGSAVENVSFEFTVDEERLSAQNAPPETVVFHRYNETTETWVATNTTVQTRSNGTLRYRTVVESFSEWVLTADRPNLTVTDTEVAMTAAPGESVAVDVTVTNDGNAPGNRTVELAAAGQVVATETVSLDGGETRELSLSATFDDPGEYALAVGGTDIGSITIQSETGGSSDSGAQSDAEDSTGTTGPDTNAATSDGDSGGLPWGLLVGGLALVAVMVAVVLWRRSSDAGS